MAKHRDRDTGGSANGPYGRGGVTFTTMSANKAIHDTLRWWDGESAMAHLLLTLTPNSLPVGDAAGWPEFQTAAESAARHFACHKRGGVYVQPANLDVNKLVRHENIAPRPNAPKANNKNRTCTAGSEPITARMHKY